jgi:alkylation response protein AidB-like acyl-CoA dehydrogenase
MAQVKDFGVGPDETMVRDTARSFLAEHTPVEKLRKLVARDHHEAYESAVQPAQWDEALWGKMVELGWPGLGVPEAHGGVGMKTIAVALLAEELGRAAVPSPLTTTLVATTVLKAADAGTWLARVAEGTGVSLATMSEAASLRWEDTGVTATRSGKDFTLRGAASFVQDARKVGLFLVSAGGADGLGLFAVPSDAPGLRIRPDQIVDLTHDQATIEFDGVTVPPDAVVAAPGKGAAVLDAALPAILTIMAADLCGAAEWQLQTTAEYARVRSQFGRPIGFFQAVKHPIVNMMCAVDRARSLAYAAAAAIDGDSKDALRLARMAKAAASDAAAFCADRSVQLHGGIGFTWECDVHLYFKRQKHHQLLWGDAAYHRARLAETL